MRNVRASCGGIVFLLAGALFLLRSAWPLPVSGGPLGLGGYVKSYPLALIPESGDASTQLLTAIRLQARWHAFDTLAFEAGYELTPTLHSAGATATSTSLLSETSGSGYRILDVNAHPLSETHFTLGQNLDRLNARATLGPFDLTLGRQTVSFGLAKTVNPTDVLLPFGLQAINQEYRIGVDAIRLQTVFGLLSELDVGVVLGEDLMASTSAAFARFRFNLIETDIELTALAFQGALQGGLGVSRSLGGPGAVLETTFTSPPEGEQPPYWRLTTGLDYAFSDEILTFVEYHFNGAGTSHADAYATRLLSFSVQTGGVYLLGRHYLAPGASWQLTPLLNLSGQLFWNAGDGSIFLAPSLQYNAAEDLYLDLGGFAGLGAGVDALTGTLRSEYGAYPTLLYTAVRYYF